MRFLLALSLAASSASALQLVASLRPAPTSVSTSSISMRARFDDAEDRRLSKGGSGGRFGKTAPKKNRALGVSGMDKYTQSDIRQKKLALDKVSAHAFHEPAMQNNGPSLRYSAHQSNPVAIQCTFGVFQKQAVIITNNQS